MSVGRLERGEEGRRSPVLVRRRWLQRANVKGGVGRGRRRRGTLRRGGLRDQYTLDCVCFCGGGGGRGTGERRWEGRRAGRAAATAVTAVLSRHGCYKRPALATSLTIASADWCFRSEFHCVRLRPCPTKYSAYTQIVRAVSSYRLRHRSLRTRIIVHLRLIPRLPFRARVLLFFFSPNFLRSFIIIIYSFIVIIVIIIVMSPAAPPAAGRWRRPRPRRCFILLCFATRRHAKFAVAVAVPNARRPDNRPCFFARRTPSSDATITLPPSGRPLCPSFARRARLSFFPRRACAIVRPRRRAHEQQITTTTKVSAPGSSESAVPRYSSCAPRNWNAAIAGRRRKKRSSSDSGPIPAESSSSSPFPWVPDDQCLSARTINVLRLGRRPRPIESSASRSPTFFHPSQTPISIIIIIRIGSTSTVEYHLQYLHVHNLRSRF